MDNTFRQLDPHNHMEEQVRDPLLLEQLELLEDVGGLHAVQTMPHNVQRQKQAVSDKNMVAASC